MNTMECIICTVYDLCAMCRCSENTLHDVQCALCTIYVLCVHAGLHCIRIEIIEIGYNYKMLVFADRMYTIYCSPWTVYTA